MSHANYVAKPPPQRFWPKVDKNGPIPDHSPELGPCWIWLGNVTHDGYGLFYLGRIDGQDHNIRPHRFAYLTLVGPIADGLELDHLCRTPLCVRPTHCEPVTHTENLRRGRRPVSLRRSGRVLSPLLVVALQRRAAGGESYRALGRELGVHHGTISRAVRGLSWTGAAA